MRISLNQYWQLLAGYLRPQGRRVAVLAALLLTSIALELTNPQILRFFIWAGDLEPVAAEPLPQS